MPEVRALVIGRARGPVIALDEPLSFWGGMDAATGKIIDRRHPQCGVTITDSILAMPSGRGSSSSSSVLAEAIRAHTAPAGIVLREVDGIVVLGALVARELYGVSIPVVVAAPEDWDHLCSGAMAFIEGEHLTIVTSGDD